MISAQGDGSMLRVRAQPGARRRGLVGVHGDAVKLAVTAPADQGKANAALIELLAELLRLPKSAITLQRGASSKDKTFAIAGLPPRTVAERLGLLFD